MLYRHCTFKTGPASVQSGEAFTDFWAAVIAAENTSPNGFTTLEVLSAMRLTNPDTKAIPDEVFTEHIGAGTLSIVIEDVPAPRRTRGPRANKPTQDHKLVVSGPGMTFELNVTRDQALALISTSGDVVAGAEQ